MMKITTQNQFYYFAAFVAVVFSTHTLARELPGNWTPAPQLGSAYSANDHRVAALKCVEGTKVEVGQAVGDLKYTTDAEFEKIASAYGGSLSASLDVPFVKASGSMSYARENAATDKRMNWFFEFHATPKSVSLDGADLRMSAAGANVLDKRSERVAEFCGNEFVYQIDYGAKLIATMSIEFASSEDKQAFAAQAQVDVNFLVGSASVSGAMSTMAQRMGSRTRVKVEAHQTGGKPGELTEILQAGVVDCNLNNIAACMETFGNVIRYANGNFRGQLADGNSYSAVRYHTMPYDNTAAFELVPRGGFPMLDELVKRTRKKIQQEFEEEAMLYDRANYIKSKLRHFTPVEQMLRVEAIYRDSFANMQTLTDAMSTCLTHADERCTGQQYVLKPYDRRDLEVTATEQVDPHSNLGKLFKAVKDNNAVSAYDDAIRWGGRELIAQCDPSGKSPCHWAIELGHVPLLSLFIREDPFRDSAERSVVHAPTDNAHKYTPLTIAAKGGTHEHVRCMDLLCEAGAGVDSKTAGGLTPLQVAVMSGKVETARKLITKGANKNITDSEGRTLMHLAAEVGSVELIEEMRRQNLSVAEKDHQDMTPLHYAAKGGHLEAVNALLRHGASHKDEDRNGKMAIHWAVKHETVANRLMEFYKVPLKPSLINTPEDHIWRVAFSPDARLIASVSSGNTVRIWDTQTGELVKSLETQHGTKDLSFSQHTRLLAATHNDGMRVWETDNWVFRDIRAGTHVSSLAFTPDGRRLAAGCNDKTLRFWEMGSNTEISRISNIKGPFIKIMFDSRGTLIATANAAEGAGIYNSTTGELVHALDTEKIRCNGIGFGKANRTFAIAKGNNKIELRDVEGGHLIDALDGHISPVHDVAFSTLDPIFASSSDESIKIWRADPGKLIYTLLDIGAHARSLTFSQDGSMLASAGGGHDIRIWNLRFDNLLHHAVRAGNPRVVQKIAEKFPLLLYIRTPNGQSPLDLAEDMILAAGDGASEDMITIKAFLHEQVHGV